MRKKKKNKLTEALEMEAYIFKILTDENERRIVLDQINRFGSIFQEMTDALQGKEPDEEKKNEE